jgi:hypothetical protein
MEQISNILKLPEIKKRTTERGELLRFFVDRIKNIKGKPYSFRMIAVKLSHLTLSDLYYFKSVYTDIENRSGDIAAQKFFWWSLKASNTK